VANAAAQTTLERNWHCEVRSRAGRLFHYDLVEALRRDLLAGVITRHDEAKETYSEPRLADYSHVRGEKTRLLAHKKAHEQWEQKQTWRAIGCGLAKERHDIASLYEPLFTKEVKAYRARTIKSGAEVGAGLCFVPLFIVFLVIAIVAALRWDPSQASPERPFTPGAPGAGAMLKVIESTPGLSNVFAVFLYGVLAFLGAGALSFAVGYPIGALVGLLIYASGKDSVPRPPPDGYGEDEE
jgi:hypothetical protein